jgi:hypothetical protein
MHDILELGMSGHGLFLEEVRRDSDRLLKALAPGKSSGDSAGLIAMTVEERLYR